jgi:multidrug efflux pump subunit AcrA (membrane-fusion protein)
MRKALIIIIIVVVLIIAVFIRISSSRRGAMEEVEQKIVVEVMSVSKGDVKRTCELIGNIAADKTAQVFPETMGRVTRILVREGSYVYKNSNIMAIRNEAIGFDYEEGYIKSPISGNIGKIFVDVGSMITPQTPVAMVVEFSRVKVAFYMPEANVGCVAKSDIVQVAVDAFPDTLFSAKVSEISPVIDPMTRTVGVKAVVSNSKKMLQPGMTALVKLDLGESIDVLTVPKYALMDGYLFVVKDSTAERREVEAGLIGDKYAEIVSGVEEGEQVITVGQQRLAGGEKVNPVIEE